MNVTINAFGRAIRVGPAVVGYWLLAAAFFSGLGAPIAMASPAVQSTVVGLAVICGFVGLSVILVPADVIGDLRRPLGVACTIMLAMWLISSLLGLSPLRSLQAWGWTLGTLLCGWIVCRALLADPRGLVACQQTLVAASLVCGLLVAGAGLGVYQMIDPFGWRGIASAHWGIQLINPYGSLVPALAPAVLWAGFALGGAWRLAALAYVPVAAAIVYLTFNRAGMLGVACTLLALGAAAALMRLPRRAARWAAAGLFALFVGATVFVALNVPKPPIKGLQDYTLSRTFQVHRQGIWGFAVHKAMERPVFGYGPDVAKMIPGANKRIGTFAAEYMPSHVHNWLFQALVETGFVGLAAMLAAILLLLARFFRAAARGAGAGWAGIALMGAFFGSWLANFSLFAAWWQVSFAILAGILYAGIAVRSPQERSGRPA